MLHHHGDHVLAHPGRGPHPDRARRIRRGAAGVHKWHLRLVDQHPVSALPPAADSAGREAQARSGGKGQGAEAAARPREDRAQPLDAPLAPVRVPRAHRGAGNAGQGGDRHGARPRQHPRGGWGHQHPARARRAGAAERGGRGGGLLWRGRAVGRDAPLRPRAAPPAPRRGRRLHRDTRGHAGGRWQGGSGDERGCGAATAAVRGGPRAGRAHTPPRGLVDGVLQGGAESGGGRDAPHPTRSTPQP
mmetsp:Transcript_53253/g.169137  ORF Transcript_53253/g.169137 Transcript_53253/m.169137 type:complete len:246 (-) Transcript_53253:1044-1781(-)